MRISDWSSDVCSSDLGDRADDPAIWHNPQDPAKSLILSTDKKAGIAIHDLAGRLLAFQPFGDLNNVDLRTDVTIAGEKATLVRSEEHTSELQSLMRISYAVFCLKKKTNITTTTKK